MTARLGLLRQVEAVARGVGVGLVEHREVVGVAPRDVAREVRARRSARRPRRPRPGRAASSPARRGGGSPRSAPPSRAAHRDGDVLRARAPRRAASHLPSAPSHQRSRARGSAGAAGRGARPRGTPAARRAAARRRSARPRSPRRPPAPRPRGAGRGCGRRWSGSAGGPRRLGHEGGDDGRLERPVAATTLRASIAPSEVSTRKPGPPAAGADLASPRRRSGPARAIRSAKASK